MPTSKIRTLANTMVFAGWMLPAALAQFGSPRMDPDAGRVAARMFGLVAGGWAFLAVIYGVVLARRVRQGLSD